MDGKVKRSLRFPHAFNKKHKVSSKKRNGNLNKYFMFFGLLLIFEALYTHKVQPPSIKKASKKHQNCIISPVY